MKIKIVFSVSVLVVYKWINSVGIIAGNTLSTCVEVSSPFLNRKGLLLLVAIFYGKRMQLGGRKYMEDEDEKGIAEAIIFFRGRLVNGTLIGLQVLYFYTKFRKSEN